MGLCPIVASYLKSQPKYVQWAAFAMGLIPFVTGTLHLYVAPIAWDRVDNGSATSDTMQYAGRSRR